MSDQPEGSSPRVAVIDIDGVLADVRHRLHHIEALPRDWDAFFAAAVDDPLLIEGRSAVEAAVAEGLGIVYLTGRPERYRAETLSWLERQGLPVGDLRMRAYRDRRPARHVKVQELRSLSRIVRIAYLLDDDPEVVQAARDAGFDVQLADWLPRAAPLARAQESDGRT